MEGFTVLWREEVEVYKVGVYWICDPFNGLIMTLLITSRLNMITPFKHHAPFKCTQLGQLSI